MWSINQWTYVEVLSLFRVWRNQFENSGYIWHFCIINENGWLPYLWIAGLSYGVQWTTWQEAIWLTQGGNGYIYDGVVFLKIWSILLLLTIIYTYFSYLKIRVSDFYMYWEAIFLILLVLSLVLQAVQKCPVYFFKLNTTRYTSMPRISRKCWKTNMFLASAIS
jgi:hypothetical protein